jgi:RNA polymerase sigma factor (sigma-70 family)
MSYNFLETIKENEGIIYKLVRIYAEQYDDQQDLYQEIIYQLWKSFNTFQGKSKISTWIYKVALNTSLAHIS